MSGLIHALLLAGGLVMLFPFVWVISTSLKLPGAAFEWPPNLIPQPVVWSNYIEVFRVVPFLRFALNTLVITVVAMTGNILSSSLVGFAFARLRFPGREVLFLLCLSTMMLPHVVTIIPTFILFRYLGWIDTFLPLTVPAWFGGSPFFIFLARQFMRTIPPEYDEAARIDGA
ncbi:MAG TPA: carbohydrate ABC transporter permease, partial [Dehalococcoidia bacterium]|nr:carbohydrate ABC transporter permease [Dehalococcoidia bacterium]